MTAAACWARALSGCRLPASVQWVVMRPMCKLRSGAHCIPRSTIYGLRRPFRCLRKNVSGQVQQELETRSCVG